MTTLEQVAEITGGGTPPRAEASYFGGGICWATPTDVTALQDLYIQETKETLTPAGLAGSSARLLPAGAVLLTSRATIGFTAVSKVPISTNQGFVNFVCGPRLQPEYLAYWLRAKKPTLERLANGATFKEISRGTVRKLEINVPDRTEQARVVDLLTRAENIVRMRREAEQKAKEIIPALFLDMFGDPARNQKGWVLARLSECTYFQEGPGILAKDFRDSGVPLLRLAGLRSGRANLDGCNFLDEEMVRKKWSHFRVSRGDLLVSTSATFGLPAVVGPDAEGAIPYTGIIKFRPLDDRVEPTYLRAYLGSRWFLEQAKAQAAGAVIKHFGPTHLRNMLMPLPPKALQEELARKFLASEALVRKSLDTKLLAIKAFQSLLASMFGEAA